MKSKNKEIAKIYDRLEASVLGKTARLSADEVLECAIACFYEDDVIPTALARIKEDFSSLAELIDAPIPKMRKALGSERVAYFLKLIPSLGKYYRLERSKKQNPVGLMDIAEYSSFRLCTDMRESLHVILLDNEMQMIGSVLIAEGDGCSVEASYQKIAEAVFATSAVAYVLVHNHPLGEAYASENDVRVTAELYSLLAPLGKRMVEHIIIAGNKYVPVMHMMRREGMDLEAFERNGEYE